MCCHHANDFYLDEQGALTVIRTELRLDWDTDGFVEFKEVIDALVRRSFDGQLDGFGDGVVDAAGAKVGEGATVRHRRLLATGRL